MVHHPFITSLQFAFQNASNIYLVTEFMIGGEMYFHLRRNKRFSEQITKFFLA